MLRAWPSLRGAGRHGRADARGIGGERARGRLTSSGARFGRGRGAGAIGAAGGW